jgi:hypothetical protein
MPSFPPRIETVKKQIQFDQKQMELDLAIKRGFSQEKIMKQAEKFRAAYLSLLKAKIHSIQEKELQKKTHNLKMGKIETEIELWANKTIDEIIDETTLKIAKSTEGVNKAP